MNLCSATLLNSRKALMSKIIIIHLYEKKVEGQCNNGEAIPLLLIVRRVVLLSSN